MLQGVPATCSMGSNYFIRFDFELLFLYRIKDGLCLMHILSTPLQVTMSVALHYGTVVRIRENTDNLENQISVCDLQILNGTESNFVLLTCAWV